MLLKATHARSVSVCSLSHVVMSNLVFEITSWLETNLFI